MTEKIEKLLEMLRERKYREQRQHVEMTMYDSNLENLKTVLSAERPILFENDSIGFNRSTDAKHSFESGNVTPNYHRVISEGFVKIRRQIEEQIAKAETDSQISFGEEMLSAIDLVLEMAERYKRHAKEKNCQKLYTALSHIPHNGAENFHEALIFLKLTVYMLRCAFNDHITLGRFDQYMYPFYQMSKKQGVTDEEIFEELEEFFISLNFDTDLYTGMQQGDNGQSMVLGGFDKDGNDMYNELSEMCMRASMELKLIDPKINLRVGKNTPDELFEFATRLTKAGLGFPQYCNDDVVVPGLVKLGYDHEDALNYTVAACWEYIIPSCGADIPNIATMDFPGVVNRAIVENLIECESFDALMKKVKHYIAEECKRIIAQPRKRIKKSPLFSIYFDGCIESLTDLFDFGTKYNNYGCHGAGIANATDALAAVKKNIYDDKRIEKRDLLNAMSADFEGYTEIRNLLRNSPKMGNNDDYADNIAMVITAAFSQNLNGKPNQYGGIWRAGTGSAMEYILTAACCPATADGRKAGEPYSSSYSPSMDVKTTGLLSVIQSFTKYDFTDSINGGPLTIEIHDSVLKNDIGIRKTAMLVKEYIRLGGHQLQISSINRDVLLDAQKHPEDHPNLIVRVWGWSGYFNELDVKYQNHIIRRLEYDF